MVRESELLSWSLFELSNADETALDMLSRDSILLPLGSRGLEDLNRGLHEGKRVALSLRTPTSDTYYGLCVFGLERPSPAMDKSLSLLVLSLGYLTPSGEAHDSRHRDILAKSLLEELLSFCRIHGFRRIHCYAPDDPESIALLIRCGFRVESAPNTGGARTFGLSLHIPATYTGDPYDGKHLLNWLAEQFHFARQSSTDLELNGYLPLRALNPELGADRFGEYALPIRLELSSYDALSRREPTLNAMYGSGSATDPLVSLRAEDLKELTQVPRLDLALWPPPPDGASIVVEVREDLFATFSAQHDNAYIASGSFGTLLERALANGATPSIFFIDFETSHSNPKLIGIGKVTAVRRVDPQHVWKDWGQISSWSDERSFARYRAIKRKMTVIVFSELRRVDMIGPGLPFISHNWTYVSAVQAEQVARNL
jgi:hypothetical protein